MSTERDLLRKLVKSARQLLKCPICFCEDFHDPPEFDHGRDLKGLLDEAEALLKTTDGKKKAPN